jgi:Arylsulfotransferase (ASST)
VKAVALAVAALGLAGCGHHGAGPPRAAVQVHRVTTLEHVAPGAKALTCRLQRRRYRTLPDVRPTPFCVAVRRGATVPGESILVTPRPDPRRHPHEQFGLMLISNAGKLLWYERRPAKVHDLKPVTYGGKAMLAYFERTDRGFYELRDARYRPVARIRAAGGPTDEHELRVSPDGTAWVASDPTVRGGKLYDYIAERVDVATGKVLWRWHALGHVPLRDSFEARPGGGVPWDYFHGNAIDPPTADDPTVMLSARNTSAVYGIDPRTGRTRWILGGKRDQFHLARHPRWVFCTQHDAQRLPGGRLLLFDNGGTHIARDPRCPVHPARALLFRLDVEHKRVRLLRAFSSAGLSKTGLLSAWVGGATPLPGGGMLVDWGSIPRVSAMGADGRENLALRLRFWSYRAFPTRWVGRPAEPPRIAARRRGGHVTVWASWNGSTEVRRWQVLAGPSAGALTAVGDPVPFEDLETRMRVRTGQAWVAVRALGARDAALATSPAVRAQ